MTDERERMDVLYNVLTGGEDDTKVEIDIHKLQSMTYILCTSLCANIVLLVLVACLVAIRYM
ncbi:hypothetical protein [Bacteroides thetaiotaomicron]|uniref:hypothetical protein n=1 Tax=Bacteroides thetaiotaomicron TaxID=818 RepID=UPI0018AB7BB4|nr:hypothetical protein [Bacteroides thetaiotaomicron]MDC2164779.1 hypothetical protein [Bacteroides thetaiotaomicron]